MNAINLYTTKTQALYVKNSQRNVFYEYGGIQLVLGAKYTQAITGIELANAYDVDVCRVSDDVVIGDIFYELEEQTDETTIYADSETLYADSETLLVDTNSGAELWSITPTQDFGDELIYLRFTYGASVYYTNPFYITSLDEDTCTRIEYKNLSAEINQSISLKFWFRQKSRQSELTTYYESSTRNTVTQAIKTHNLELYESEFMSIDDLILTATLLESPYLYIDNKRCSLFEAIKIPELTQQENFGKLKFIIAPNN